MRLSFLDSIRGIASLIVVTAHLHYTAGAETWFVDLYVLRIFKASAFAVAIFFVLSGLVLFLQVEGERVSYIKFVVRRAFRIFPACAVAVTVSYAIYVFWEPQPVLSRGSWFNDVSWPPGIPTDTYIGHLLLDGSDALLRPIWSLVIEWRVSLIYPAIVIMLVWSPIFAGILAIALAVAIAAAPTSILFTGLYGIPGSYLIAAYYSTLFAAGAFIAAYRLELIIFFRRWPMTRYALWAICVYFLCFRSLRDGLLFGLIGCALIVVCMSQSSVRQFLRMKSLRYLGKISYCLYLVHIIWIGVLFRVLDGVHPLLISSAVIVASVLSADLMSRFIEIPANRMGRAIVHAVKWPAFITSGPRSGRRVARVSVP